MVISLLPVTILGCFAFYRLRVQEKKRWGDTYKLLASNIAEKTEIYISSAGKTLRALSKLIYEKHTLIDEKELADTFRQRYPVFESIVLLDRHGIIRAYSGEEKFEEGFDFSYQPYFRNIKTLSSKKIYNSISKPFTSNISKEQVLIITSAIIDENENLQAVLSGTLSLSEINRIAKESATIDRFAFIIDNNGTIMAHPENSFVIEQHNWKNIPAINHILQGQKREQQKGIAEFTISGKKQLSGYAPIYISNEIVWWVFVSSPLDTIYLPITLLKMPFTVVALLSLFVGLLFAGIVSNKIENGMNIFSTGIENLSKGNLDTPIRTVATDTQTNQIFKKFNHMVEALKKYINDIKETTAKTSSVENEIEIAQHIKISALPGISMSTASAETSGLCIIPEQTSGFKELYDYFKIQDQANPEQENLCIVFVDIMDNKKRTVDISTSLVDIKEKIRIIANYESSPSAIIRNLQRFTTGNVKLFLGIYNPDNNLFTYTNAGFQGAILASKLSIKKLSPNCPPLGKKIEAPAGENTILLSKSDVIVLYNEDLVNIKNEKEEPLEEAQLKSLIEYGRTMPLSGLFDIIQKQVSIFSGKKENAITISGMKIK